MRLSSRHLWTLFGSMMLGAGVAVCGAGFAGSAFAATGFRELDHAAIAVKYPAAVDLVAITRAGNRLVAVGEHGVIILSDDSGGSWRQASVPVNVTLTGVEFDTPNEGWAVGHFGVILHSMDGGETWTRVLDGIDVGNIMLATAQKLNAVPNPLPANQTRLEMATAFQQEGPTKPFLDIASCGADTLAIGAYDIAMLSGDGGKTWQDWSGNINNSTLRNLYSFATVGNASYIVGETGLVLRSDNGCAQFNPVTSPSDNTIYGILPTGDGGILVFGLSGTVFKSKDQGNTWTAVDSNTASIIAGGTVLASGKILLGTMNGQLLLSSDQGVSFKVLPVTANFQVAGFATAPDKDVVTIGNGGVEIIPAASLQ